MNVAGVGCPVSYHHHRLIRTETRTISEINENEEERGRRRGYEAERQEIGEKSDRSERGGEWEGDGKKKKREQEKEERG